MSKFSEIVEYKTDAEIFDTINKNLHILDFSAIYDQIRYQGFNRTEYLQAVLQKMSLSTVIKIAMIGAVRGSNFAKISKIPNLPTDVRNMMDSGTIKSSEAKKSTDITITRCTAALPQWCAYALFKSSAPGRISNSELPGCLQFPAAGSLPMSAKVRSAHIKFSDDFSSLIHGNFKPSIYKAMYNDRISVANVPPELLPILGLTTDEEAKVDIDQFLSGYSDVANDDDAPLPAKSGSKRRRY